MATLICFRHPQLIQENGNPFCGDPDCGRPLTPAPPPTTTVNPAICPAPSCGVPLVNGHCPLHPGTSEPLTPGQADAAAFSVGNDPETVIELEFPWGRVPITGKGTAVFGRSFDNPWGPELARYDNVSRHHAEFTYADGALHVRDTGSLNGVTVNGRQIIPGQDITLTVGDELGFGADLRANVRACRS